MDIMNYKNYTLRQLEIIWLFSAITETRDLDGIKNYLGHSWIFSEIGKGNEAFLYDSSSSNLMEIITELRESIGDLFGSEIISPDTITRYNRDHYPGIDFTEKYLKSSLESDTCNTDITKYAEMKRISTPHSLLGSGIFKIPDAFYDNYFSDTLTHPRKYEHPYYVRDMRTKAFPGENQKDQIKKNTSSKTKRHN